MEVPTGFATPTNTTGISNPTAPTENGEVGSGDVFTPIENERKKKTKFRKNGKFTFTGRSLKEYVKSNT